jgi:hypothetical protein
MNNAKFIVVQDVDTANQLIASGFNLISNVGNTYTFINVIPKHFNFENIDVKKLVYTNTLVF